MALKFQLLYLAAIAVYTQDFFRSISAGHFTVELVLFFFGGGAGYIIHVSQFKALVSKVLLVRAGGHNWVLFQLSGSGFPCL